MKTLKVLICDDNTDVRSVLAMLVSRQEGFELCGEAGSGQEALELFERLRPDVVFMDIEMPGLSGIECARQIFDASPLTRIIFATAHSGYMDKAFELYAFDYLIKPFRAERINATFARIAQLERERESRPAPARPSGRSSALAGKRLMIKRRDAIDFVDMDDIILVQREDRATTIYTADTSYQTSMPLSAIEEKLDPSRFMRTHKSYIVNLDCVDNITPYGRWTYVIRLKGTHQDALITAEKLDTLRDMFG